MYDLHFNLRIYSVEVELCSGKGDIDIVVMLCDPKLFNFYRSINLRII